MKSRIGGRDRYVEIKGRKDGTFGIRTKNPLTPVLSRRAREKVTDGELSVPAIPLYLGRGNKDYRELNDFHKLFIDRLTSVNIIKSKYYIIF